MKSNLLVKAIIAILLLNVAAALVFLFSDNEPRQAQAHVPQKLQQEKPLPPTTESFYKKIRSGDTVYSLLKDYGFSQKQVGEILRLQILPESLILVPGHLYRVIKDSSKQLVKLKFYDRQNDNTYVLWKEGNKATGKVQTEPYNVKVKTVEGQIKGSIIAAIRSKVPDKWIAYRFLDAYTLEYDFRRDLQRGAYFSVTYEEKYDGDQLIKSGEVLETKLEVDDKVITRHFVRHTGGGSFIGPMQLFDQRPFYSPVDYMHITSKYNPRRLHPIKGYRQPHRGIDFALPEGEEVYAVRAGKVLRTGKNRAAGRYIVIRHNNGLESYYNHLASINKSVRSGIYVKSGQEIGTIGCSGYCTKPHLHFAVKRRGRFINPIGLIRSYPYHKKDFIERRVATIDKPRPGSSRTN